MSRKPLRRKAYIVALDVDGDRVEHEIEVAPADQLRAETTGRKYGLPAEMKAAPMSYTILWLYLALKRLGLYEAPWQQFTETDLYEFEPVEDDDPEEPGTPVDPTTADPSGSASSSPATTATPGSGSTPTSTSGF